MQNFAAVRGDKENKGDIEGPNKQVYEALFINMWELFKQGKFREATMHWNNKIRQDKFIEEINSMRYLKYWVSKI